MQPVPVVYGMTIGEYAMMLAEKNGLREKPMCARNITNVAKNSPPDTPFHFLVIKCGNYTP